MDDISGAFRKFGETEGNLENLSKLVVRLNANVCNLVTVVL